MTNKQINIANKIMLIFKNILFLISLLYIYIIYLYNK